MKNIQKLELADIFFPDLLSGNKTRTLRWNEHQIKKGFLIFYTNISPPKTACVWVTSVKDMKLQDSAPLYNMTPKELHESMLAHYPDIKENSMVSYIEYLSPTETKNNYGDP